MLATARSLTIKQGLKSWPKRGNDTVERQISIPGEIIV